MMTICASRLHCVACRTRLGFRRALMMDGKTTAADFECPFGVTAATAKEERAKVSATEAKTPLKMPSGGLMGHAARLSMMQAAAREQMAAQLPAILAARAAQGAKAWKALHEAALAGTVTEVWLAETFRPMIPQFGCTCLAGWDEILRANPLRTGDQFAWSVEVHNAVSAKINPPKPQLTAEEAYEIWKA